MKEDTILYVIKIKYIDDKGDVWEETYKTEDHDRYEDNYQEVLMKWFTFLTEETIHFESLGIGKEQLFDGDHIQMIKNLIRFSAKINGRKEKFSIKTYLE